MSLTHLDFRNGKCKALATAENCTMLFFMLELKSGASMFVPKTKYHRETVHANVIKK